MVSTRNQGSMNGTKDKRPMKGVNDKTKSKEQSKELVKGTKGKSRKRPRSPTPIEERPLNVQVEQPSIKKQKDVQTAKSDSLMIPVDETCPLAGKVL